MKCPLCHGELKQVKDNIGGDFADEEWDYDCPRCGRAWKIMPNGDWHAWFDSSELVYTSEDVQREQKKES